MCLALVAIGVHPRYPLLVAANRDEFHRRPAAPAQWWSEGWFGGRDLEAGGTWLGVAPTGRWALLTNVREPSRHDPRAPSRGALVPAFLADGDAPAAAIAATTAAAGSSNGFNLLGGDATAIAWASNRAPSPRTLTHGVHGLSNALLDTPWPKVRRTATALRHWCAAGGMPLDALVDLLADRTIATDDELPSTGVPLEWERRLSAPFIVSPDYGTRCSTVFAVDGTGNLQFIERSFAADGSPSGEVREAFRLRTR
jgi:uncharacterized protein with NRDE domain